MSEEQLDRVFAGINQAHLPGAAAGVAVDGRLVYRKAFGLASMELPVLLSSSTRMRVGSITKHFTALAFMLLCERGQARLDDPVGKYCPEFNAVARRVTVKQLMQHTSGLRDVYGIKVTFSGIETPPVTVRELMSFYASMDANGPPDAAFIYNNGGYQLLGDIIERITGRALAEFLKEEIFEPVGMHDTLLRKWDTEFVANSATCHMTRVDGTLMRANYGMDNGGCGAIVSTVDDMLRWLAHMDSPSVGTKNTWDMMKVPYQLTNGVSGSYGLGLGVSQQRGIQVIGHSGGGCGCSAHFIKVPTRRLGIVVMTNRDDISARNLAGKLLEIFIPPASRTISPTPFPLVTGVFRSPTSGSVIELSICENEQRVGINGAITRATAHSMDTLQDVNDDADTPLQLIKLTGDRANPDRLLLTDCGSHDEFEPVGRGRLAPLEGSYHCSSIDSSLEFFAENANGVMQSKGRYGSVLFQVEVVAEGIWRIKSAGPRHYGGVLTRGENPTDLLFFDYSQRALRFERI